ncbi:unnamed protein product [Chrysodeixis includens]|uniref:UDP-glucuronosyltransferase n=1 Tax=Chrysodeixis includens TaxID=689277 RepID=A0A9P0FTB6_CHRIL|nr:unnamed protein product [Chrysodeixis includens]
MSKLTLMLLLTYLSFCCGYKLLLVFPFPSLTNSVFGQGFVRNLLKAGHEVTYITPYPMKNATKALRQIEVTSNTNILTGKELDVEDDPSVLEDLFQITNATVMHKNVQKLLIDTKEKFDAVIAEWMYSEVYAGFSSVFNCPLVWSSPMLPNSFVLSLINEDSTSYSYSDLMTSTSFWRRQMEQFRYFRLKFHRWLLNDKEKSLFNRAFGPVVAKRGGILPPFEVTKHNGSLVLGNSHYSIGQKLRLPLNYVSIAGFHIDEKREILPKNLQKIMDGSKKGVVYIRLGSMLGESLPKNIETTMLDIFKEINRTVIWEHDEVLKTPNNVHVFNHVEQQSILAHKNCVLFISNGNLLSVIEAVHFGMPIIGIPTTQDQVMNMGIAVHEGFAKMADLPDMPTLKAAIDLVLQNPKYRELARSMSSIYHDRPITPSKELVYWIEHVIRNGGKHLRSAVADTGCYSMAYLAVATAVIVVSFIVSCACFLFRRKVEKEVDFKKFI